MNPDTGELRALMRDQKLPEGFERLPGGFFERIAREELRGRESAHIDLRSAHPLAKWAAKQRAAKKRKAKIAAASRRRNRK